MSEYDWRGYIDVTDIPLARLVVEAFRLSLPVGRGYEAPFMRALSEEEALQSVQYHTNCASVDYITAARLSCWLDLITIQAERTYQWSGPIITLNSLADCLNVLGCMTFNQISFMPPSTLWRG